MSDDLASLPRSARALRTGGRGNWLNALPRRGTAATRAMLATVSALSDAAAIVAAAVLSGMAYHRFAYDFSSIELD